MPNAYDNIASAAAFSEFLESDNGRLQKQLLLENITPHLPSNKNARILDAACGEGWLSDTLKKAGYTAVEGFDSAKPLIAQANSRYSGINFQVADAAGELPYSADSFDTIILNMAGHDLNDLSKSFKNLNNVLKLNGTFIVTIANPYYAYPVGIWKRGILGVLLKRKPRLKIRPYHDFRRQNGKLFNWKGSLSSYFYPLSEYINQALDSGFNLTAMQDLGTEKDSASFNVQHQFYRFPLIILLAFEKRAK